jgi:hypothetical protein
MPHNPERYDVVHITFLKGPDGEMSPVLRRLYEEAASLGFAKSDYKTYIRLLLCDRDVNLQGQSSANYWYPPAYLARQPPQRAAIREEEEENIPDEAALREQRERNARALLGMLPGMDDGDEE